MKITLGNRKFEIISLAEYCGGVTVSEESRNPAFSSVCTDSREADETSLFCAMKGERVDGHDYIASAIDSGCRCFLCEAVPEAAKNSDSTFVVVPDTVTAMNRFASEVAKNHKYLTVAVTGSVGKTTTKEFISSAFPSDLTYHTKGNYNSVVGLPLSLLEIPENTEYAVLEMGMSGRGEIEMMSRAARPDIAVITNIGSSHLELLGTRENIRAAKLEIVAGLKPDGILLLNGDDKMLVDCKVGVKKLLVGVENPDCNYFATSIAENDDETVFDIVTKEKIIKNVRIPTIGRHNIRAALFAYATASLSGIDEKSIIDGLSRFKKPKMRQDIYQLGGITIIEDCYNASPESMKAALDVQKSLYGKLGGRQVALLGNMLELGEGSPELHRSVGEYAAKTGVSVLITYGELAQNIADAAKITDSHCLTDINNPEAAAELLLSKLQTGDILLVKASRSVAAEKIVEILKERLK